MNYKHKIQQDIGRNLPKKKSQQALRQLPQRDPLEDPPGTRSGEKGFMGVP